MFFSWCFIGHWFLSVFKHLFLLQFGLVRTSTLYSVHLYFCNTAVRKIWSSPCRLETVVREFIELYFTLKLIVLVEKQRIQLEQLEERCAQRHVLYLPF